MKYFHNDATPGLLWYKEPARGTQSLSLILYCIKIGGFHARKGPVRIYYRTPLSYAIEIVYISPAGREGPSLHRLDGHEVESCGWSGEAQYFHQGVLW